MEAKVQSVFTEDENDFSGKLGFYAGLVLYHPDSEHHIASIQILLLCNVAVIVFDNSDDDETKQRNRVAITRTFGDKLQYLESQKGNIGLSAAYNQIVKVVLQDDLAQGLFLFDQDTDVNSDSLRQLQISFYYLQSLAPFGLIAGYPVRDTGIPYRVRPRDLGHFPKKEILAVHVAPSSFTLIPVSTLQKVGEFQEDFFIDHIDLDFCLRCWQNRLPVYVDKKATFFHRIGIGDVLICDKPLFPIATPFRHYYQMRNSLLSGLRAKVSMVTLLKRILLKFIVATVIGIYAGNLLLRLKFTIKGMIDGFRDHGGKLK